MRWAAKVELMHTVLADSWSYLVGGETGDVIVESLDFLEESLADGSTKEMAKREDVADCFSGAVEANDDDGEFLFSGQIMVEALEEMIHGQGAAKHASTAPLPTCHGLLLLFRSVLVWPPPLPARSPPPLSPLYW